MDILSYHSHTRYHITHNHTQTPHHTQPHTRTHHHTHSHTQIPCHTHSQTHTVTLDIPSQTDTPPHQQSWIPTTHMDTPHTEFPSRTATCGHPVTLTVAHRNIPRQTVTHGQVTVTHRHPITHSHTQSPHHIVTHTVTPWTRCLGTAHRRRSMSMVLQCACNVPDTMKEGQGLRRVWGSVTPATGREAPG